jgi:hypothetical protein
MSISKKEKTLAVDKIIHSLHKSKNGYVFGGYYRDQLNPNADYPRDLDIWIFEKSAKTFLRDIADLGYVVTKLNDSGHKVESSGKEFFRSQWVVSTASSDEIIVLDLYHSDEGLNHCDVLPIGANVDSLYFDLDKSSILSCKGGVKSAAFKNAFDKKYTIESILNSIATNKYFIDPQTFTKDRWIKLDAAGFYHEQTFEHSNNQIKRCDKTVKEEGNPMAETKSLDAAMSMFMSESKAILGDAAYRSTGRAVTKAIRDGLVSLMRSKGVDDGMLAIASFYLDTEMGKSLIGLLAGLALPHVPGAKKYPQLAKLSKEFKVEAAAGSLDVLVKEVTQFILPGVMQALSSGSELEGMASRLASLDPEEEEEQEEVQVKKKAGQKV